MLGVSALLLFRFSARCDAYSVPGVRLCIFPFVASIMISISSLGHDAAAFPMLVRGTAMMTPRPCTTTADGAVGVRGYAPSIGYSSTRNFGKKLCMDTRRRRTVSSGLHSTFPPMDCVTLSPPTSSLLAAELVLLESTTATWKQYVSLGVILIVVLDIVLGSPLLNMVTAPLKSRILLEEDSTTATTPSMGVNQPRLVTRGGKGKERIDTEAIAKEALDKADSAMALRDYLDRNKTDKDRMEQLQREIDRKLLGGE